MKNFSRIWNACLVFGLLVTARAAEPKACVALASPEGIVRLEFGGDEFGTFVPGVFEDGWTMSNLESGQGDKPGKDGVRHGTVTTQSGVEVATELRISPVKDGQKFSYKLTPKAKAKLNSLFVRLNTDASSLIGGRYVADGAEGTFPKELKDVSLKEGDVKSLKVIDPKGNTLVFDFAAASPLVVQDDRQWSEHFIVHIGPRMNDAEEWAAGKSITIEFTLTSPKGITAKDE